jgi:hypothetical protein
MICYCFAKLNPIGIFQNLTGHPHPPPPSRLTRTLGVRVDAIGFHLVQQGWQVRRPGVGDGLARHNGHKNKMNLAFLYRCL